jgi:diguanylate cyclase (GGDEF)-like protein
MHPTVQLLLIEDDDDDALLVARELDDLEEPVAITRVDSAEGLALALTRQRWDAVVSDYLVPGFCGLAALRQVRRFDEHLPFILVSSTIGEDVAVEAMRSGACDYVMKSRLARLAPALQRELRAAAERRDHAVRERAQRERLEYLACHDPATGLANRSLMIERMNVARSAAGSGHDLAVVVLQAGGLGRIEEVHGSPAVDAILREAARRIMEASPGCRPARIAAERFALLVTPLAQAASEAIAAASSVLRAAFERPFAAADGEHTVRAALGIEQFAPGEMTAETALRNAEAAAQRAQANGLAQLAYAGHMGQDAAATLAMERRLRRAVIDGKLDLHYQPKVHCASGIVTGAEALLRWHDHELGAVPPSVFVPLLEETGLIGDVFDWVVERSLADRRAWAARGIVVPRIAVNVSVLQLRAADFATRLDALLARAAAHDAIELEVTESVLMEDVQGCIEKLATLRGRGVRVSIDDFGTGFSSLSYLARLPLDAVKIDRTFVAAMLGQATGRTLVEGIIGLAHALHLEVVAEGVETEEQRRFLSRLGCDEAQGFWIARPMPAAALGIFMHSDARTAAQTPALASTTIDTPSARPAAPVWRYECATLPGKPSTSPAASS